MALFSGDLPYKTKLGQIDECLVDRGERKPEFFLRKSWRQKHSLFENVVDSQGRKGGSLQSLNSPFMLVKHVHEALGRLAGFGCYRVNGLEVKFEPAFPIAVGPDLLHMRVVFVSLSLKVKAKVKKRPGKGFLRAEN